MADDDAGHALIEALLLGVLLLIPVVWMLTVFADLHAAALGTTSAAREAAFEAARSADVVEADRQVILLAEASLADHGLDPTLADVTWTPDRGWGRGASIDVVVTYRVPVFQAPLLGQITEPAIAVSARHLATIDRFRSRDR